MCCSDSMIMTPRFFLYFPIHPHNKTIQFEYKIINISVFTLGPAEMHKSDSMYAPRMCCTRFGCVMLCIHYNTDSWMRKKNLLSIFLTQFVLCAIAFFRSLYVLSILSELSVALQINYVYIFCASCLLLLLVSTHYEYYFCFFIPFRSFHSNGFFFFFTRSHSFLFGCRYIRSDLFFHACAIFFPKIQMDTKWTDTLECLSSYL